MGLYIRITCRATLDAISNMRDSNDLPTGRTLLQLCPAAHSIHYHAGEPVGLLIDLIEAATKCALTHADIRNGLRLVDPDVMRFGKSYGLYEPNRRTTRGREIGDCLDALKHSTQLSRYTLELIAPRIRATLSLDEFGYDYKSNAQVHFLPSAIYVAVTGVSIAKRGFDTGTGVELINRDEYRAAVLQSQDAQPSLLFCEDDSLVVRSKAALDPFYELPLSTVNRLLTDIYTRVLAEPKDIRFYVNDLLLEREQVYVFTTLVAILHAFYGIE